MLLLAHLGLLWGLAAGDVDVFASGLWLRSQPCNAFWSRNQQKNGFLWTHGLLPFQIKNRGAESSTRPHLSSVCLWNRKKEEGGIHHHILLSTQRFDVKGLFGSKAYFQIVLKYSEAYHKASLFLWKSMLFVSHRKYICTLLLLTCATVTNTASISWQQKKTQKDWAKKKNSGSNPTICCIISTPNKEHLLQY